MPSPSGFKRARRLQLGAETVAGTAVPATTIWRGPAFMPVNDDTKIMPDENPGLSSATTRIYTPAKIARLEFPETEATFEQFPYPLRSGLKDATLAADGPGTGYIGVYPVPSLDGDTIKTYTIEGGDLKTVEEAEYCFTTELQLSGRINEAWKMSHKMEGRQTTVSAFTGALARPAVEEMKFNLSKLFIDNVAGTIGTTQMLNNWIYASIKIVTGWRAQATGSGELFFSHVEFIGAKATVELELLHNAQAAAERALWKSDTPRQLRILIEGTNLTTPGTTYTKKTCRFDCAGVYMAFGSPNDEHEGTNIHKVTFECGYDGTAAKFAEFLTVHQLAALP